MLCLLCLKELFQGFLDALEEAGRHHEDCHQTCLGKWQEQAWGYASSKAARLSVTLSPENLIQRHQPCEGSVANLRVCLLSQPAWFSQAVQITVSIVGGRDDGKEGEEGCAKGKPGNLHLFSVSWKFSSVVKTVEYFIFFDFLKDKLLLKEKKIPKQPWKL